MSTNPWFKHWSNSSQGHTLSTLWANGDCEGIALFWLILELVCRYKKRDSDVGEITISWDALSRETNWKPSKCRRVLARISPVSQIEMNEKQNGYVSFLVHNWLKYQDSRGGKRLSKKEQNPVRREKREERRENTDTAAALFNLWNKNCGKLPMVKELTEKRIKLIRSRLKEEPDLNTWSLVIGKLAKSDFCNGKGSTGWVADFDFLLKPDTRIKTIEGKYDNRGAPVTQSGFNIVGSKTIEEMVAEYEATKK